MAIANETRLFFNEELHLQMVDFLIAMFVYWSVMTWSHPTTIKTGSRYVLAELFTFADGHPSLTDGNPYTDYVHIYYWVDEFIP